MGISIKLAPGIRVRASKRGIRSSFGPRGARVHVGGGRAGFSTGVGPFSYYASLGGSGGQPKKRSGKSSTASVTRSLASLEKAKEARAAGVQIDSILSLHREWFEGAEVPRALMPDIPSLDRLEKKYLESHLEGIGFFRRGERSRAKQAASLEALQEYNQRAAAAQEVQRETQQEFDALWQDLLANDPQLVMAVLEGVFEDNDAAAAPLGITGSTAQVAVLVPGPHLIPSKEPGVTETGRPSLRKMTKSRSAELYVELVAGYGLVTVKEALAAAPGLEEISIISIRQGKSDSYGRVLGEALMAFTVSRADLLGVRWETASAMQILQDACSSFVCHQVGRAKELQPLTPDEIVNLETVLAVFNFDT